MPLAESPEGNVTTGEVLAGKYRVIRVLGRGGMGVVVEATHMGLNERVAIKVLHPRYCTNAEAMARFQLEAKAAVRIRGEHSVRLIDVGTAHDGAPFIVMELLEGADLLAHLKHGAMPIQDAVLYILQACEGMAEVHANGIIHRDLKPGNLFVARRPDGTPLVKVLDFGIAKSVLPSDAGKHAMTMTMVALGTPLYMSPEQVRCSKYVDARTDIWSLGAILYELVGGKPAFGGNTVANITAQVLEASPESLVGVVRDLPPELDRVIRKALSKKPEHRFPDMATFAHALAPFVGPAGKVHAERATRILRGDGRISTSFPVPVEAGEGATTQMESEILTTHVFARRRKARVMFGSMFLLVAATMVSTWAAIAAYRERTVAEELMSARSGVAAAGEMRTTVVTRAALAPAEPQMSEPISLEALPTATPNAPKRPAPPPPSTGGGPREKPAPRRPPGRGDANVDVLSTRK